MIAELKKSIDEYSLMQCNQLLVLLTRCLQWSTSSWQLWWTWWRWWRWWRCYFTCDTCYPIFPLQDPHWCRQCLYVSDDQDLDCLSQCASLAELSDYLSASLNIAGFSWVLPPEGRYAEIETFDLAREGELHRHEVAAVPGNVEITSRWGGCV